MKVHRPMGHLRLVVIACLSTCATIASAQYNPTDPGWIVNRDGTQLRQDSRLDVLNNRATAKVEATGASLAVGANLIGRAQMNASAQVNGISLAAVHASGTQVMVHDNRMTALLQALGGTATANSVLAANTGTKSWTQSRLALTGNRAGNVRSIGAGADLLLGAASLQMPGQASANSVMLQDSSLHYVRSTLANQKAVDVSGTGGASVANGLSLHANTLSHSDLLQSHNVAQAISSGGGKASLGWAGLATLQLEGLSAVNTVLLKNGQASNLQVAQLRNEGRQVSSVGGSALVNSLSLAGDVQGYRGTFTGNHAEQVDARGVQGSVLGGLLVDVKKTAVALANSAAVQGSAAARDVQHDLVDNTAKGVSAAGGAAAANSVWLDNTSPVHSPVRLSKNVAERVSTSGGSGSVGGGAIASWQRNGRAFANAVMLDSATQTNSTTSITSNRASDIVGDGATTAANSLLIAGGTIRGSRVLIGENDARDIRATGGSTSAGGGLLASSSQVSVSLGNSIAALGGGTIDSPQLALRSNWAGQLRSQGGSANANSISVEGTDSRLSAPVALTKNRAVDLSSNAGTGSYAGGVVRNDSKARAAGNSVIVARGAQLGGQATLDDNVAQSLNGQGGTVLANALALYENSRTHGTRLTLRSNKADTIKAVGGSSSNTLSSSNRMGVATANAVYMESAEGASVRGAPIALLSNQAERLASDGGMVHANSVVVNGRGLVDGTPVTLSGNVARDIDASGENKRDFLSRSSRQGTAQVNALVVLGTLRGGSVDLLENVASSVSSSDGHATVNALVVDQNAAIESSRIRIANNEAQRASSTKELNAELNSVVASHGSIHGSDVTVEHNQGSVEEGGMANAVVNRGKVTGSHLRISGSTQTKASKGGVVNSVVNLAGGEINGGSRIHVLNNQGTAQMGGVLNSVVNGGTGRIQGATVSIINNRGGAIGAPGGWGSARATDAGIANSVINTGQLSGKVIVANNEGLAGSGAVINSVVNEGKLSGVVRITGNRGVASGSSIANSVINRGTISGSVNIIGRSGNSGGNQIVGGGGTTLSPGVRTVTNSITVTGG